MVSHLKLLRIIQLELQNKTETEFELFRGADPLHISHKNERLTIKKSPHALITHQRTNFNDIE